GGSSTDGIDEDNHMGLLPGLKQGGTVAIAFQDTHMRALSGLYCPCDKQANTIIAAIVIANANNQHRCTHTFTLLLLFQVQLQKMRGAGDTGIIIANGLFAPPGQLRLRRIEVLLDVGTQILFDRFLILRGGWNNPGLADQSLLINLIPMIEDAA